MRELTYNEAALEAIAEEMRRDPKIFYMSTDAIPPLLKEFGDQRVRATPITEAALTGMGIGAAGSGFRPIVDWRQVTFCFVAMDQIVNQAAKIHYMFGGQVTFPILFRASVGGGGQVAAQHSQSPYSMFMNVAGLKMFLPSTPYDMKGLLKTAIRDNNPVISFESGRLMGRKGPVPEEDYTIPLGKADVKREGSDVTVVALAWLVHEALAAAEDACRGGDLGRGRRSAHAGAAGCGDDPAARCGRPVGWSSPTRRGRPPASRRRSPRLPPRTPRHLRG